MKNNALIGLIVAIVMVIGGSTYVLALNNNVAISDDTKQQSNSLDMSAVPDNLEEEVRKAISRQSMDNVVVIDVRTDQEWNDSHATNAFHWGLAEHIENGNFPPIDKSTEIYVYCRTGNRSGQAIKAMQKAGYTNLTNMRGLSDWVAAGGSTTAGIGGDEQMNMTNRMMNE